MQTFLPHHDFTQSAKWLDRARLGKQRVEAMQIIIALNKGGAWSNHPATKMWKGFTYGLATYGLAMCNEWRLRGYQDGTHTFFRNVATHSHDTGLPIWLGDERLHASHRAALLWKAETRFIEKGLDDELEWYERFDWQESPELDYFWPCA